jgi:hypothetical protein
MLTQLFDILVSRHRELEVAKGVDPMLVVRECQQIHSMCIFELVRQVSVQCLERGLLLRRLWEYVPHIGAARPP